MKSDFKWRWGDAKRADFFGNQSHIFGKSIAMSVKRIMYWANINLIIKLFKLTLELVLREPGILDIND